MEARQRKYLAFFTISFIVVLIPIGVIVKTVVWKTGKVLLVKTAVGPIQGYMKTGTDYYNFLGVPYAVVNKSMPFGESIPYPPFENLLVSDDEVTICPQREPYQNVIKGDLNCLRLNIYVPKKASVENRMPVLVYIYGGYYEIGAKGKYKYGPKYLIKNDVIVITFSYRVGPYGFMCLDIPEVSGNQGIKDQIKALKWIKQNIAAFGGDPDKITVAGGSSTSQEVFFHITYNKNDLFQQAILESGIKQKFYVLGNSDPSVPIKLAADLGFKTNDVKHALSFLTLQKSHNVIASSEKLNLHYLPCLEKNDNNSLITEHLSPSSCKAGIKNISVLVGLTKKDRLFQNENQTLQSDEYQHIFEDKLNDLFVFDEDRLNKMTARVRHFYLGDEKIIENVKQSVIDFISDLDFNYPTHTFLQKCINNGDIKKYVYSYTEGSELLRKALNNDSKNEKVTRVDQIINLFDISFLSQTTAAEDQLIVSRITELWANFTNYRDPIPATSEINPMNCKNATSDSIIYLDIGKELKCGVNIYHDRMAFWDLFYKLNDKYARKIAI